MNGIRIGMKKKKVQTLIDKDAEIAALKAEVERLRIENASLATAQPGAEQNYYFMLQGAKQEIAKLKAQLAAARRINEQLMAGNDRMEAQLADAEKRGMERAIEIIPTNWLDPLLSGGQKVIHKSHPPEIERLLLALRERIRAAMEVK